MCGIFGYVGPKNNAPQIVLTGLKSLEYRGYDSWGIAVVPIRKIEKKEKGKEEKREGGKKKETQTIVVKKRIGRIGDATIDELPPSSFALGHTRWATHGGVTNSNAHPHLDCTKTIALIHNGIVENYEGIKKKLRKKGHTFTSETDTEVIVHLIEEYRKTTMFSKAVQKAFNDLDGLNAIIAISTEAPEFVAARNGSPLVIGFGEDENYLASDSAAILPHTKQVHFMEDGQMAIVRKNTVLLCNAKTGETIHPNKQTLTWSVTQAEKGSYDFFMIKEIYEQPGILSEIAAGSVPHAEKIAGIIKKSYGGYMIGCGTAAHACIAGTYLFSMLARRHINWAIGSEFGYSQEFLTSDSLVIALSQSGETMDTLEAVKKAKGRGAKILALVNVLGSTLYRESDYKILLGAGPEKGVASTKAFIAKLAHIILLASAINTTSSHGKELLLAAAKSSQEILKKPSIDSISAIAKKIVHSRDMYVIGRGLSYPASLETALKIKEISYIHAEGFAAGELKHGVLALIEKKTACIAFLPNDETYGANLAGAMEMKARGGTIIGISHTPHEMFDYYINVPDAKEATIIPNVIVGQLLAYYLATIKGFDPDMPRNLAKSVTVK